MKKVLLSLGAALLMAAGAQAQTGYGLKAGVNLPKMKLDLGNSSYTTDASTNFYITGYANISAGQNFAIQPGISLQGKGGKEEIEGLKTTTNLMSIEIPVNAVYYIPTGTSGSLFLGAGPYVGFNISGQTKVGDVKTDIDFGSELDEMKVVDYGANFQGGYKFSNGFLINAGYGLGLGNLSNSNNIKANNRVLSFGVGFEF
jgi:hypothetical protein